MAAKYDLLILTDATASMGNYLRSLNKSLPEIIKISSLTGCFDRVGVLAYRDYFKGKLTEWSGWLGPGSSLSQKDLLEFTQRLTPEHGGDWPEAAKTGLAHAYSVMRADAQTLILVYADAPPHTPATGGEYDISEQKHLKSGAYGTGSLFLDWISAANTLRNGEKKATVISIIQSTLADTLSIHLFLSHQTQGTCLHIADMSTPEEISSLTVNVLLTWMGVEKNGGTTANPEKLGSVMRYKESSTINDVTSERDELSRTYFVKIDNKEYCDYVKKNLASSPLFLNNMKNLISRRMYNSVEDPVMDFSKRYAIDEGYRALVARQLAEIIESNVISITINPVFGTLWRTVCNDRLSESRDNLIELFGTQVNKIVFPDKKAQMKAWLDESYDYAGEILHMIESVPDNKRYPCVFLDPTVTFTEVDDQGNRTEAPMTFTRDELLEIGRSCDYRTLGRLGRVMARLTYVATESDLPDHIRNTPESEIPRIPMALALETHKHKFWKVLLHTVLPGTMLAPRPAALLAALSLRMGIKPLELVADKELLAYKKWNTLDIPETWNTNCLTLLLEADKSFRNRHIDDTSDSSDIRASILEDGDRRLFQSLVDYKMLEMNLDTTLTARIGWHPERTKIPVGPLVVCQSCNFPRSVTMMSRDGHCGLCVAEYKSGEERKAYIHSNVSIKDTKKTSATWVECSMKSCRAQYIIYNIDKLNVRPKCWYCRMDEIVPKNHPRRDEETIAPCVECSVCLSRVVWPIEYRPHHFDKAEFRCSACHSGRISTVINVETSARKLVHQERNGTEWLLRNDNNKISKPLNKRSVYHVISSAGIEGFVEQVEILPSRLARDGSEGPALTIEGKRVRNPQVLVQSLRSWVDARLVETGTCLLCFNSIKKANLRPACGRRGCGQQICNRCFDEWYGVNSYGRIINVAALTCPFCRRQPTTHVLPNALRSLGNLKTAVEDRGWVYAWCWTCGIARRFVERVCAVGAPAELDKWSCDDCRGISGIPSKVAKIKKCPGCGVLTEKAGGCDHIECIHCNTHWCYFCGQEVHASVIYSHMSDEHGGWYDGGDDYYEDEYDWDLDE